MEDRRGWDSDSKGIVGPVDSGRQEQDNLSALGNPEARWDPLFFLGRCGNHLGSEG